MPEQQTILIADSHDITRASIAAILMGMGYNVLQAIDGAAAIKVVQEHTVDLVIFDHAMSPVDGYQFAKYLQGTNSRIPRIMMLTERTSDMLNYTSALDIKHILAKPIDPPRLQVLVERLLASPLTDSKTIATYSAGDPPRYNHDTAMIYLSQLAHQNVAKGFGGPFAAIITNEDGEIIGEGVNLYSARFDPIAHAEVMAIRQAAERRRDNTLQGCTLYMTAQATAIGQALISNMNLRAVYYALSHEDVRRLRGNVDPVTSAPAVTPMAHPSPDIAAVVTSCAYDSEHGTYRIKT